MYHLMIHESSPMYQEAIHISHLGSGRIHLKMADLGRFRLGSPQILASFGLAGAVNLIRERIGRLWGPSTLGAVGSGGIRNRLADALINYASETIQAFSQRNVAAIWLPRIVEVAGAHFPSQIVWRYPEIGRDRRQPLHLKTRTTWRCAHGSLTVDAAMIRHPEPVIESSLTLNEAAEALGVSRRTLDRAIADGTVRTYRVRTNGYQRITPAEIKRIKSNLLKR